MPTSAAIIVIFFASHLLRGLAVDHLVVVDPASNHLGWYGWSLLVTALRWQWWIALLLHLRSSGSHAHRWIFLVGLLAVDACFTYTPRYSKLVYGELSASGHQAMMALHTLLSICENASLLFLALVAARRPILLPMLATISALKIFISDLPAPEEPFIREIFASGLPVVVYLVLAAAVSYYLRGRSDREGLLGAFSVRRSPRSS
ncbi:MAG: hypothetical protein HC888_10320 [Candidatus Competibacteraceae bacterium]|nr:hypothetical protein [Candidatus Competibacteraceae bacterium]